MIRLNVGSGSKILEGYINCDVIALPNVDIVAAADKLPYEDNKVDEVLSEHMIEHLTFEEFNRTIVEWYRVLKSGGVLTIETPDLMGICEQFVTSNYFNQYTSFKGYWPLIAHFYGHQRGSSLEEKLGQVHKSGYTYKHLFYCLEGIGFKDLVSEIPRKANPHSPTLRIRAFK